MFSQILFMAVVVSTVFASPVLFTENDAECIKTKSMECHEEAMKTDIEFCKSGIQYYRCLKEKFGECKNTLTPSLNKVLVVVDDICTHGTELNEEYQKIKDCMDKVMQNVMDCVNVVDGLEDSDDFARDYCKNFDKVSTCVRERFESCGKAEAIKKYLDADFEFSKATCDMINQSA